MRDTLPMAAMWRKKRDRIRWEREQGIEQGRAEEAEQDAEPVPTKVSQYMVTGWRTKHADEEGERYYSPYPNMVSGIVWGMLQRGHRSIMVDALTEDGRVAYQQRG